MPAGSAKAYLGIVTFRPLMDEQQTSNRYRVSADGEAAPPPRKRHSLAPAVIGIKDAAAAGDNQDRSGLVLEDSRAG